MATPPSLRSAKVSQLCGGFALFTGLGVLTGWYLRIPRLADGWLHTQIPMSPLSAILFVVFGGLLVTLRNLKPSRRRLIVPAVCGFIIAVGATRIIDLVFHLNSHFDQWLFYDRIAERGLLQRVGMAPTTAAAFMMAGVGLMLVESETKVKQLIGQYLVVMVILLSATAFIGHLYQTLDFYQVRGFFPMALSTSVHFLVISCGVLALRPRLGFVGILTAPNLGGVMARQLFPIIIIVPPLLGLLSLYLSRQSAYDPTGETGILVTMTGLLLAIAVLATSHRLEKTAEDLTQRGQELEVTRAAADGANRAKSEFLANMSHELRTPLNAVIGFSEILRDARFGPLEARYREYAGDIFDSGRHLLAVVNNILDLAKIEANRLDLIEDWVSIPELTAACFNLVRDKAVQGSVSLELKIAENFALVRVDETRMKQIFLNLLSNAIKFTPSGGAVTVIAERADDGVLISVCDTGIGMDKTELEIAVLPFRQVDSALSRRYEGTGLGLPLARALVDQHGGALRMESVRGVGTTAIIWLPAHRIGGHVGVSSAAT